MITKIKNWIWPEEKCHPIYQTLLGFWHDVYYNPREDKFIARVSDDFFVFFTGDAADTKEAALEDAFQNWKLKVLR